MSGNSKSGEGSRYLRLSDEGFIGETEVRSKVILGGKLVLG
jgi:hypothetical protein